jgi:transposase
MDKITQLKRKQAQLDKLQKEVESLEKSKDIQKEMAFADELAKLLKKYGKSIDDITKSPAVKKQALAKKGRVRKRRKLKVYVNPHTKEKVETRGGNHKVLKAWKAEHGNDEVESWLQN